MMELSAEAVAPIEIEIASTSNAWRDEYLTRPGTVYMLGADHETIHIRVVRTFCRVSGRGMVMEVVKA